MARHREVTLKVSDRVGDMPRSCLRCGQIYVMNKGEGDGSFCTSCGKLCDGFIELINNHNSRARVKGNPATLTLKQWVITMDYFNWNCAYCQRDYTLMEHIIPISQGGGTTADNCVPACHLCNVAKSNKPLKRFASPKTLERITNFIAWQRSQR
jgi:hypothetical protein